MCQTSVIVEHGDSEELLLENVTALEVIDTGISITTLFEGKKEYSGISIQRIDFNAGKVFCVKNGN